jgi:hypothetical protein
MCDLFDEKVFEEKLRRVAAGYQKRFGDLLKYDVEEEIAKYKVRKALPTALTLNASTLRCGFPV